MSSSMKLRIKGGVLVEVAGNKMGNRHTEFAGEVYHSKKEADYAAELQLRLRGKDIKGWERQVRMPLVVNGTKIAVYALDFVVEHCDGSKEYIEVKGFETALWKLKWRLFDACYPELKKTIVR